ncbi:MAG: fumarylacetoacetate hydrolase family protein, partial [Actinomycetota bacterium]|nr:fumarylacetoacetate hydrolase family protein [Actinomycetota bacterium]
RAAAVAAIETASRVDLADVALLPPIPDPKRILCVGVNYSSHAEESDTVTEVPPYPMIFTRFASSLVGHGAGIERPRESTSFDYEGEMAVVIGSTASRVSQDDAASVIGGYSCLMDGTLRDWQRHTSQFVPGKNFDRSGGWGPWIVTADDVPEHAALQLETRVNGEVVQSASTSQLIHGIERLIEYCSAFTTLEPGDVIATGTPGGVGYAQDPPRWLVPGNVVEVEISGVGLLSNAVIDTP